MKKVKERIEKLKTKIRCISNIMSARFFEVVIIDAEGIKLEGYLPTKVLRAFQETAEDVVIDIRREIKGDDEGED